VTSSPSAREVLNFVHLGCGIGYAHIGQPMTTRPLPDHDWTRDAEIRRLEKVICDGTLIRGTHREPKCYLLGISPSAFVLGMAARSMEQADQL
jgi:hypothetical protein